jgi:hypothetical protein
MKRSSTTVAVFPPAIACLALALAYCAGCKAQPVSEVVLAVQTDMSLPKDIDTVDIQVSDEGVVKYTEHFTKLGSSDGQIHLPATLGLLQPTDPTDAVDVIVDGRTGGLNGEVIVLNEIVTTVPTGRIVTLQMPLEFLCLGSGTLLNGTPENTCPDGLTCVAGTCTDDKVPSSTLPDYGASDVLGDGSCFDGASCWTTPQVADLDMTTCSLPPEKDVNVALQTEGVGICGPAGCFVTLDANSPNGWQLGAGGRIDLPPAVCKQITMGLIVDVVTTPVTTECGQKNTALPTCGPWSSAKHPPPAYVGPLAIAGGQARPVAVAVDSLGDLYWINAGLTGGTDGTVKGVGPSGGAPTQLAGTTPTMQASQSPRDLLITGTGMLSAPIWSSATPATAMGALTGTLYTVAPGQTVSPPATSTLYTGLASPEGLAINGSNLFWTDFQTNTIFMGSVDGTAKIATLFTNANYPYRIVADGTYVYWTDEGTSGLSPPNGAIESLDYTGMTSPPTNGTITKVSTPRAIALETNATGTAAVWYATFEASGSLVRVPVSSGLFGTPAVFFSGLSFPNGIAIDGTNVYWTNRGAGTVQMLPLAATMGTGATTLATNQLAPGTIAVDDTYVYWVNEGTSTNPTGGVIKLPKP